MPFEAKNPNCGSVVMHNEILPYRFSKPFLCRFPGVVMSVLTAALSCLVMTQVAFADWVQATGGNAVHAYRDADGVLWQAHIFTDIGAQKLQITQGGEIEYVIVAGGGSGGSSTNASGGGASGGGAGGVVVGTRPIAGGTYDVVVGAGGKPVNEPGAVGSNGENSSVFGLVALGGGGGAGVEQAAGADGGSGGGGGRRRGAGGKALQPTSESGGLGHDGAIGAPNAPDQGSGGGGAGAVGTGGRFRSTGQGGDGLVSMITGKPVTYAIGGLGGIRAQTVQGIPGRTHRGDGGGGGAGGRGSSSWAMGGAGGSGIVVIRYKLPPPTPMMAEGGEVTTMTDDQGKTWRVHTFKADGELKILESGFVEFLVVGGGGGGSTITNHRPASGGGGGAVVPGGKRVAAGEIHHLFVGIGGKGAPVSGRGTPGMDGDPSSAFGVSAAGGKGGFTVPASVIGGAGAAEAPEDENGGPGLVSIISSAPVYFGGGGGTAIAEGVAGRGIHGGGDASGNESPGKPGAVNTGGGGGGSNMNFVGGGDGGSGIVIVRYPIAAN